MRGTDVQWVQQKIGCLETDGVFDEKTYRSVRKYQELKRIRPATGSVTKATWKALGV
jgi:peptidoglycan hydrolase-like protein with peptidoglycan-binding domain